jgi:hypothetical protein
MGRNKIIITPEQKVKVRRIKKAIKSSGFKRNYVADWCGMSNASLSNILSERFNMTKGKEKELVRFINAKIDKDFEV